MSAFKAANPDAVFEDFIRWHSPRDWEEGNFGEGGGVSTNEATEGSKKDWPPQGRLSERMSEGGNSWRKIWNDAPALPASEQKPLSDPNREGEKVKFFLVCFTQFILDFELPCPALHLLSIVQLSTNVIWCAVTLH